MPTFCNSYPLCILLVVTVATVKNLEGCSSFGIVLSGNVNLLSNREVSVWSSFEDYDIRRVKESNHKGNKSVGIIVSVGSDRGSLKSEGGFYLELCPVKRFSSAF